MTNSHKKPTRQGLALLILIILFLTPLSLVMAQGQAVAVKVAGTYSGSVTVDEPAALGALDLVFNVTDNGGALSGQVNGAKTQVFLGGPTFTGSITGNQGGTPTFRIDSQPFTSQISGRAVQRQFTLVGEVLNDNDTLRGQYTETITGFTPKPLLVKGKFLVVRPGGSEAVILIPSVTPTPGNGTATPPAPTPTPTATATSVPDSSLPFKLYLPVIAK